MDDKIGEAIQNLLDYDVSPELKKQLIEVRKGIADEYIQKLVKDNPPMLILKDQLTSYLVNDGGVKDVFFDIFREHTLSIFIPEQMEKINLVKEKLGGIKEMPTADELSLLKSDIMENCSMPPLDSSRETSNGESIVVDSSAGAVAAGTTRDSLYSESSQPSQSQNPSHEVQDVSSGIDSGIDEQGPFIENVYKSAASQIGVKYTWGGTSPETGFDCSGLWNWAFKQQGIKFQGRLSAAAFSGADVDITKDQVKPGDFMYWDQKPGKKKHSPIYHIEMVISKPYVKNGKTYVRTLGSSTDAKDDCGNYVGRGVSIREREMKDYRHYGRPPYYYQLAHYEKTGQKDDLVATANQPSSDVAQHVV